MLTLHLDQDFVDACYALARTQDAPELGIAALLVDLAWQRARAGGDLRRRWSTLTNRQQEIALLVFEGNSYKEIARKLGVGPASVRTHARALYARTGVSSKRDLRDAMSRTEVLDEYLGALKTRIGAETQKAQEKG